MRTARRWVAGILAMGVAAAGVMGCSNPCRDLANFVCKRAGAQDDDCVRLRKRADQAGPDDRKACEQALEVVKSLSKTN